MIINHSSSSLSCCYFYKLKEKWVFNFIHSKYYTTCCWWSSSESSYSSSTSLSTSSFSNTTPYNVFIRNMIIIKKQYSIYDGRNSILLKFSATTTTEGGGGGGADSGVLMSMSGLLFIPIFLQVIFLDLPFMNFSISPHSLNYVILLDILSLISYTWWSGLKIKCYTKLYQLFFTHIYLFNEWNYSFIYLFDINLESKSCTSM